MSTAMRWRTVEGATALVSGEWRLTVDGTPAVWCLYRDRIWRGDFPSEAAAKAAAAESQERAV